MLARNIFSSLILCIILITACQSPEQKTKEYGQAKQTLTDQELENPGRFVRIIFEKKRRNLVGKSVVKFRLLNTATTVTYKDVRVRSLFFHEGKLVANHEDVYDDVLNPGDDEDETIRYRTPRGTDSVALEFMSAKAERYKH